MRGVGIRMKSLLSAFARSRLARWSAPIVAASLLGAASTATTAADRIGEALAVVDRASASGEVGQRALLAGTEVYLGDTVETDGQGEAQLLFTDGTRMVVGPDSLMVLDEYVFRGGAAENKFAVRALSGAFRFFSGNSPSDAYEIRTPSGTMGVRGTEFDIAVTSDETKVLLYDGGVVLCGAETACAEAAVGE